MFGKKETCSHAHRVHTHTQRKCSQLEHPRREKWKCTKLRNASQQTTLIMINMPNKWTLKISSVLSFGLCAFSHFTFGHVMLLLFFRFIIFLIAFIGISLHNALCDLFLSCCSLHDYFLSIHLPFGCIMKWNRKKSTFKKMRFSLSLSSVQFGCLQWKRSLRTNVITPTFIYSFRFFFSSVKFDILLIWYTSLSHLIGRTQWPSIQD